MKVRVGLCVLSLWLLAAGATGAAVVTVNTGSDPIDIDWQTATVADLPGPDGKVSFSEAMIATNNTPGHDIIEFAIPEAEWELQWLYPGYAAVYSSYTYFWRASDGVSIDGTTQADFTGDRHPDAAELILYGDEIYLGGGDSTFMGVHGGAVSLGGTNNLVTGNTGGINISVFGGSANEIRGNECGTIKIDRSSNNIVAGNVTQRVRVWGSVGMGMPGDGNVIGGPNANDRNFITGYGTTNSEGLPAGAAIQLAGVSNTVIENNWIGTTVDGLAQGNLLCTMGVSFEGENFDTTVRDNRIAGILGHGQGPHHAGQLFGWAVFIAGSGSGITITGNTIGLDANDEALLGSVTGIDVGTWNFADVSNIQITNNVVAGHLFNGITVGAPVPQVRISGNEIYANTALGIDLVPSTFGYGVTENDPLDADEGGNGLQNFPVVTEARTDGSRLLVSGTFHSTPDAEFTLEFFASPTCHESGHGEGQSYLGSQTVVTDAEGNVTFEAMLFEPVAAGWMATATATREPLGATSEFSACVEFVDAQIGGTAAPEVSAALPRLGRPWPNPANPLVSLELSVPFAGRHHVRVMDARGRTVATLLNRVIDAGTYVLRWNGQDDAGQAAASGIYYVQLIGSAAPAQRVALIR